MQAQSLDRRDILSGMRQCLPLALSVFAYGLVFGLLALQAGLSAPEALLMSGMVFAGSAQFVVLELWQSPLPIGTIIATTFMINLRFMLMGAALRPWYARLSSSTTYGSLFFLTDEGWALSLRTVAQGRSAAAVMFGSGLALYVAWVSAAGLGRFIGHGLRDPSRWGLDFVFTAVLLALLVGFFKRSADLLVWGVAAVVAVLAAQWLPGQWYILLGGLSGSLVGALRHAD